MSETQARQQQLNIMEGRASGLSGSLGLQVGAELHRMYQAAQSERSIQALENAMAAHARKNR